MRPLLAVAAVLAAALPSVTAAAQPAGDPVRGEAIYERCQACHSIERNRVGPMHACLFGRPAGTVPDFDYSRALPQSGIVWDAALLDRWLQNPNALVPRNGMGVMVVPDPQDRADVIAYLRRASDLPGCPGLVRPPG